MMQPRLYPAIPPTTSAQMPAWCFYPMSKKREARRQLVHAAVRAIAAN